MALYCQGKIDNTSELDKCMQLIDLGSGVEMSNGWYRTSDPMDETYKMVQAQIVASIKQTINFDSTTNKFHRNMSFQDDCVKRFPTINMVERNKIDNRSINEIGILVCKIGWDSDQQITTLQVLETFIGKLGRTRNSIDRQINSQSKYIRMYKNLQVPVQTDFFVADGQSITSLGMASDECVKYINYKTSIIDPVTYMLESVYSDIDSIQIDTILDAGLSTIAFQAYVAKNQDNETFETNPQVRTKINWTKSDFDMDEYVEKCAFVWNQVTKLFGNFISTVRGDCVYIADGPRMFNLMKNYPIRNYTDLENAEIFNKYLPYFNGYSNNYVARYWNWVYIEDMQWTNRGIWVPGSVVMGAQLVKNDLGGHVWDAPAGQERGLVDNAFDVSVKTKQYNEENDTLYQNHWNFFNIYQNEGVVVEGQKTTQTKKTALDRLNVRRMVCWIKQQARIIANRYKYEPHTASMRNSFRKDLVELLMRVQNGSGISDYYVVCDESNNTTETIDRHELWCKIAIKPIKAIEYIVIDIDIINNRVGLGNENVVVKQ